MNSFAQKNKQTQTKINQRIKIKSKYFGEYEPQLFIASRSKSKSNSTNKDQLNMFNSKHSKQITIKLKPNIDYQYNISSQTKDKPTNQLTSYNTINPEIKKSQKSSNQLKKSQITGSLFQYLSSRKGQGGYKKQQSAIQKIINWVQRKYNEKIINKKILKIQYKQQNSQFNKTKLQRFQYWIKKLAYDMYILKGLKSKSYLNLIKQIKFQKQTNNIKNNSPLTENVNKLVNYHKQNDIDNIILKGQQKINEKAEDFDIYKFKNSMPYDNPNNLFPISQLSFQNMNRSNMKNSIDQNYSPEKQDYIFKQKLTQQIPTMNSFQTFKLNYFNDDNHNVNNENSIKNKNPKQKEQNKESRQRQKSYKNRDPFGTQNSRFFTQTARSTQTNEVLQNSKNDQFDNSNSQKDQSIQSNNKSVKNKPIMDKDLKRSFTLNSPFNHQMPQQQTSQIKLQMNHCINQFNSNPFDQKSLDINKNILLRIANRINLNLIKNDINKIKDDTNYGSKTVFNNQRLLQILTPIQVNILNSVNQQNQQILNQIFQMNDNQQQILQILKNKSKLIQTKSSDQLKSHYQLKSPVKQQDINENVQLNKNIQTKTVVKFQTNPNKVIQINKNKQNKKTIAENYFSQHLQLNNSPAKQQQIKTYQMPLIKAQTDMAIKAIQTHYKKDLPNNYLNKNLLPQTKTPNKQVFTFNSISNQAVQQNIKPKQPKISYQKKQQNNAFINKFDCFGICKNGAQLQRSNYFTDTSASARQRGTSCNSNQSKQSSKPKISFNYVSPSSKIIAIQTKNISPQLPLKNNQLSSQFNNKDFKTQSKIKQKDDYLFKSKNSQLKNYGMSPVNQCIKQSREKYSPQKVNTKNQSVKIHIQKQMLNKEIQQCIQKIQVTQNINTVRPSSKHHEQKQRSQSVPHFVIPNQDSLQRQNIIKPKINIGIKKSNVNQSPVKIKTETNIENQKGFGNPGSMINYNYQSQKVIGNVQVQNNIQHNMVESLYKNIQSYYFPNIPPNIINSQMTNQGMNGLYNNRQSIVSKKDQQFVQNKDHHYLYPLKNSIEKKRAQRAKSMNQKVFIKIGKAKV